MERKFQFSVDEYYHIYNRGIDKRKIFLIAKDYERFTNLLYFGNDQKSLDDFDWVTLANRGLPSDDERDTLIEIGAYCLMPNHFHLLVKEKIENGISKFMLKLSTGYVMYFNKRHERSGALLERPFRANHVDRDEYLRYLFAYIHLNPLKIIEPEWRKIGLRDQTRAKNYLERYPYSSYLDWSGQNGRTGLIQRQSFPDYFDGAREFENYVQDWLNHNDIFNRGLPSDI